MDARRVTGTGTAPRGAGAALWWTLVAVALASAACAGPRPALDRTPGQGPAEVGSARAATRAGDWSRAAASWYQIFLRGSEHELEACLETARALSNLGDHESAKNVLDLGLERHPGSADLLEMQGNVLVAMGFRRAAEPSYELAIRAEPQRRSALRELGRLRVELGKPAGALEVLARLVELGDHEAEDLWLYGCALHASGRRAEALHTFEGAFELGGANPDRLVRTGCLAEEEGLRRQDPRALLLAERWLREAARRDPQCSEAHYRLGRLAERSGDLDEAVARYRRAIETDPSHLQALDHLARLHCRRGERQEAAAMVERALALEKDPQRQEALRSLLAEG